MISLRASIGLVGLAILLPINPAFAEEGGEGRTESHYRLFVGDHAAGEVRVIEAGGGEVVETVSIDQSPALYRSVSGNTVFAVQGDKGKVAVIDTGIAFEDHGDHGDLHVEAPKLLPATISGAKPAHVVEGSGRIAVFDDGSGDITTFTEKDLSEASFAPVVTKGGIAHHGLAAPMGDYLVVSVGNPDHEKPRIGLKVLGPDGAQVGDVVPCPDVHGQAQSARSFAFGCKDGIVIAEPGDGGAPKLTHWPTGDLGEGNVSTLKGGAAMKFFLGNFGPRAAVVVIDPSAEQPFRKIELPTRRVDFALDPVKARFAYILTEDGDLHRLNIVSGKIDQTERVTEPYSMDGHWRDPRPRLAVAGDHIAVTDPKAGLIRMISTETLKEERSIPVEGTPYTIVAVGGSGQVH